MAARMNARVDGTPPVQQRRVALDSLPPASSTALETRKTFLSNFGMSSPALISGAGASSVSQDRSLSLASYMAVLTTRHNVVDSQSSTTTSSPKRRNSWSAASEPQTMTALLYSMKDALFSTNLAGTMQGESVPLLVQVEGRSMSSISLDLVTSDDDYQSSYGGGDEHDDDSDASFESVSDCDIAVEEEAVQVLPSKPTPLSIPDSALKKAECIDASYLDDDDEEDDTCFICMGGFENCRPEDKMVLPCAKKCNQAYVHGKCIFEWRERRNNAKENSGTCPLCRGSLSEFTYSPPDVLQIHNFRMFSARKHFLVHPIPKDYGMVRCYLRVTPSSWIGNSFYEMYIQGPCALPYPLGVLPGAEGPREGDQLLMCAKKRSGVLTSRLEMSFDCDGQDFDPKSPNYAGYVQSNFSGLEHTITSTTADVGTLELGCVSYSQNRFGLGVGPRKMKVCLPQVEEIPGDEGSGTTKHITKPNRPSKKSETLAVALQKSRETLLESRDVFYAENREPCWLEAIQAYSLDFHGRVTLPSNKNFQLCILNRLENKQETALQFGKVVSHECNAVAVYTLDFKWPISPLQAFGIALSSCDRKLACA